MNGLLPLRLTSAEVRRQGRPLLDGLDLEIAGDGITVVIGPNGAGKSTLLRALHGLERLSRGQRKANIPEAEARKRQAFVFQRPILLRRTVRQNLAYPLRLLGRRRVDIDDVVAQAAADIGLEAQLDMPAARLSGGEAQKLALARAMITTPELLFLDEPCASIDGRATREIETLLRQASDAGTRIVMTTHDLAQARRLADEVVFLFKGRIVEADAAGPFFEAPTTQMARRFLNGDILE